MNDMQRLTWFIKEVRSRGYSDAEITRALLEKGWPSEQIKRAFSHLDSKTGQNSPKIHISKKGKTKIEIYLDYSVLEQIEKRAKRNILSIPELIEDIVRRSVVRSKLIKSLRPEKLDDLLVGIFSRRQSGKK